MPSDRWAKADAKMGELYERVDRERAEKEAEDANAEAERARYISNPNPTAGNPAASTSETTLVAGTGHQPTQSVATHRQRAEDDSEKALGAWERWMRWQAKYYKTNMYDKPKPASKP